MGSRIVSCHFGALSSFIVCPINYNDPPIYIEMGVDANFPQSPCTLFSSEPLVDTIFTRSHSSSYKDPLTPTWLDHSPNIAINFVFDISFSSKFNLLALRITPSLFPIPLFLPTVAFWHLIDSFQLQDLAYGVLHRIRSIVDKSQSPPTLRLSPTGGGKPIFASPLGTVAMRKTSNR
jgi:hypothetical protein